MGTSELDTRRVRAAKNQSVFRDVNERIENITEGFAPVARRTIEFVCECAHPDCSEVIGITHGEYESIRRFPTHFAVKSGHDISEVEQIVAGNARYIIVSKLGTAGQAAIRLDPRGAYRQVSA